MFNDDLHARVHHRLRDAFVKRDLDEVEQSLELVASPRFARQQIVREVLAPDENNRIPFFLHCAIDEGWTDVLPYLVKAGARLDVGGRDAPLLCEQADEDEQRPVMWYSALHDALALPSLRERQGERIEPDAQQALMETVTTLLRLGANTNRRNDEGYSALALVVKASQWWAGQGEKTITMGEALLNVLLDHGADPTLNGADGERPIHSMVQTVFTVPPYRRMLAAGVGSQLTDDDGGVPEGLRSKAGWPFLQAVMVEREQTTLQATLMPGATTAECHEQEPQKPRRRL